MAKIKFNSEFYENNVVKITIWAKPLKKFKNVD